jgi:adenylosuccinate synthase
MGNVTILVGAQWGDEGKGKWVDILSHDSDVVVRYQGGNNAGHTLYIKGEKVVLHQIPSGIFGLDKECALAAGVVVNPSELVKEIEKVSMMIQVNPQRLWLSARAHVITPWHIFLDGKREHQSINPIGTTKRGIGPTYESKASRAGLRLGDYVKDEARMAWVSGMRSEAEAFGGHLAANSSLWKTFHEAAAVLKPYVCDAEERLRTRMDEGKKLLIEGAQGALLDINHGTFPYVTSSPTIAGGAISSIGFSPKRIGNVLGVSKAYCTRVGEGPFPTELQDDAGRHMAKVGNEFGATTGRPRRCGWLDAVALRYSQRVNGLDGIIFNKLDILTGLPEIKVATAYRHAQLGTLTEFPSDLTTLRVCEPVYTTLPGWHEDISGINSYDALPRAAREYIAFVEKVVGCKVVMVGTGVRREDAIFV